MAPAQRRQRRQCCVRARRRYMGVEGEEPRSSMKSVSNGKPADPSLSPCQCVAGGGDWREAAWRGAVPLPLRWLGGLASWSEAPKPAGVPPPSLLGALRSEAASSCAAAACAARPLRRGAARRRSAHERAASGAKACRPCRRHRQRGHRCRLRPSRHRLRRRPSRAARRASHLSPHRSQLPSSS
eukprot:scaffold116852_cov51-Phaeocystis_antarctica.AAC.2